MSKTLILLFHPDLTRSRTNAALAAAAAKLPGAEIVDMQAAYPQGIDFLKDSEREALRLLSADRIVLQFPVQWYSTPPLLKAWQDAVLTRMFYIAYEQEGRKLEGTPLLIAATAGNVPEAYREGGRNMFPMIELFAPCGQQRTVAGSAGQRRLCCMPPTRYQPKRWRMRPTAMRTPSKSGSPRRPLPTARRQLDPTKKPGRTGLLAFRQAMSLPDYSSSSSSSVFAPLSEESLAKTLSASSSSSAGCSSR